MPLAIRELYSYCIANSLFLALLNSIASQVFRYPNDCHICIIFVLGLQNVVFPPFPKYFAWPIRVPRIVHGFIAILRWWRWFRCGFLTMIKFPYLPATSGFCSRYVGLRIFLHVMLLIGLPNVAACVQVFHIRFGRYVHLDRGYFVNYPTWTILQMCFIFEKHHVRTLDEFLYFQLNEPIRLGAFAIYEKQTFDALHVQLRLPLIQHLRISHATKNAHVQDMQHPLAPHLFGCLTIHDFGWTRVAVVAYSFRYFHLTMFLGSNNKNDKGKQNK